MSDIKNSDLDLPFPLNLSAPDIYVDGYHGAIIRNNVARINFFAVLHELAPGEAQNNVVRKHVLTLTLSIQTLEGVTASLLGILTQLRAPQQRGGNG